MSELPSLFGRFYEYSLVFKGNSPDTIRWLKFNLNSFQRASGIQLVKDIRQQNIEAWIIEKKLEKNWSPRSIRHGLLSMRLFLDWCKNSGLIESNCARKIPFPKIPKLLPKHLSKEEATSLLEWTEHFKFDYKFERHRALAIIAMFIFTGIRLSELRNLKISEVDIPNRTLFVKSGKGDKDRVIPLNYKLISVLEKYLADRKRMKKCCPYFFTAMRQDSQMGDLVVKRLVIRLREKSGIYFYPHLLRHTFATLMLEGGCDLFSLSKMMRHSDIKTTTIYLSATTGHLQEQIGKHPLT